MNTTRKNTKTGLLQQLLLPVASATLLLASVTAHAGKFGVHVVDEQGEPMAGVAVCVGMHGNYKQFGALFTGIDGNAVVDVPNVPLLVTVSQNRFTGKRMSEPARGFNLIKQVRLIEGVPGPRCRAGSALAESEAADVPPITIRNIDISEGAYSTTLTPNLEGDVSHYRISANNAFEGARWQQYSSTIALSGALSDEAAVFLQFRRYEGSSRGWLEARSNVVTVRLPVQ